MDIKILILSRKELAIPRNVSSPSLLIAIRDPEHPCPPCSFSSTLRIDLAFDDISYQSSIDLTFTFKMAQTIARTLKETSNLCTIIVSCEMGISRSAGLAAALDEHFNARESDLFYDPRYEPNQLVYKIMKAALNDIK